LFIRKIPFNAIEPEQEFTIPGYLLPFANNAVNHIKTKPPEGDPCGGFICSSKTIFGLKPPF
jgi:hypothetical protein